MERLTSIDVYHCFLPNVGILTLIFALIMEPCIPIYEAVGINYILIVGMGCLGILALGSLSLFQLPSTSFTPPEVVCKSTTMTCKSVEAPFAMYRSVLGGEGHQWMKQS